MSNYSPEEQEAFKKGMQRTIDVLRCEATARQNDGTYTASGLITSLITVIKSDMKNVRFG